MVWFIPALTTWVGVKFKITKSVTVPVHGAIDWDVTVNIIGVPAAISAALGVYIGFNIELLLKVPLLTPLLEFEVQVIVPLFWPVTPVIWKGSLEQLVLFSTPASSLGSFWITTVLVAVATEHTGSPKAVNRSVKPFTSLLPGVYWAVSEFAFVNVPLDVPLVVHNTEFSFVAVAVAVKTVPSQIVSFGVVVTTGAGLMVMTISSKSVKAHKASDWATNRNVTEFNNKSAAEKL